MTIEEFWQQEPPGLCRCAVTVAPDDWPVKGVTGYNVNEMRVDYVKGWPNGAATVAKKLAAFNARKAAKKAAKDQPLDIVS